MQTFQNHFFRWWAKFDWLNFTWQLLLSAAMNCSLNMNCSVSVNIQHCRTIHQMIEGAFWATCHDTSESPGLPLISHTVTCAWAHITIPSNYNCYIDIQVHVCAHMHTFNGWIYICLLVMMIESVIAFTIYGIFKFCLVTCSEAVTKLLCWLICGLILDNATVQWDIPAEWQTKINHIEYYQSWSFLLAWKWITKWIHAFHFSAI